MAEPDSNAPVALLQRPVLMHELMAYEMKRTSYVWQYSAPPGATTTR